MVLISCSNKQEQTSIANLDSKIENKISDLISEMTLEEKLAQISQVNSSYSYNAGEMKELVRKGIGSILNEVDPKAYNELQKIAMEESRMKIPIIFGRDVIHGFRTIFPIPLGQAASWDMEMIETGARIAATEARSQGVNWAFAPMLDIARDARWGRIAESAGEDPYLASLVAAATVKGFQGKLKDDKNSIAACAKHFIAYGAAEGGRDYNTTIVSDEQLRNTYLPPFRAAVNAGALTVMSAFNEINGIPASGNNFTLKQILRNELKFNGFVVSDWGSVTEMITHGYAADDREAAKIAINAGVDMEMASDAYRKNIQSLLETEEVTIESIDQAVRNILRVKFMLGLFDNPYLIPQEYPELLNKEFLEAAKDAAIKSTVLLKNDAQFLPFNNKFKVAVIGPLADAPHDQMGTWAFDGKKENSITPLSALREYLGAENVIYAPGLKNSRTSIEEGFPDALNAAVAANVVLFFGGEEAMLSGEAHSRGNIDLPGAQNRLIAELFKLGKPIVLVVMAGRPLTIGNQADMAKAVLYAWHPGTMGGPALVDLLWGKAIPSAKLPVTFPKAVGQIPIYYNHKNTGRPAPDNPTTLDVIEEGALQTSLGNTSYLLDYGKDPLYPFGFGLSYTNFEYKNMVLTSSEIGMTDTLTVITEITNTGMYDATEIVQLYIRDIAASVTRPVKELKDFKKVFIKKGETLKIEFKITSDLLSFYNIVGEKLVEKGICVLCWLLCMNGSRLRTVFFIIYAIGLFIRSLSLFEICKYAFLNSLFCINFTSISLLFPAISANFIIL